MYYKQVVASWPQPAAKRLLALGTPFARWIARDALLELKHS